MKVIRKRLTYANVMSSLAVFLTLGGAAFAATQLPKNSVGTKQLKADAVVGSKVADGSLTGADINSSTLGTVPSAVNATNASHAGQASSADSATNATNATNATHADSADNATNATNAVNATNAAHALNATSATNATHADSADSATTAKSSEAPETLESGKTLRGHYDVTLNVGTATGGDLGQGYSYAFPLPSAPTESIFVANGEAPPAQCPGTVANPQAAPGYLCIFEGPDHLHSLVSPAAGSDKYGFGLLLILTGGNSSGWSVGTWAVTAP